MNTATIIQDAVSIKSHGTLPNGVHYIIISYDGTYDAFKSSPVGFEIVYRSDKPFATKGMQS
jgi:hypothetical protein